MRTKALIVAASLVLLALPAQAKSVYSWVTEDGVHSFTDDKKRIPKKYSGEAERKTMRSIRGYARYTPTPERDRRAYLARMPGHLAALRAKNGEMAAAPVVVQQGVAPAATGTVFVGSGRRGTQGYAFSGAGMGDGPVVVEKVRTRPDSMVQQGNATRTVTVVRQGDKIVAVLKTPLNDRPVVELNERDLADYVREASERDGY